MGSGQRQADGGELRQMDKKTVPSGGALGLYAAARGAEGDRTPRPGYASVAPLYEVGSVAAPATNVNDVALRLGISRPHACVVLSALELKDAIRFTKFVKGDYDRNWSKAYEVV